MVELVDTMDLKSIRPKGRCRFDSCMGLKWDAINFPRF